MNNSVKNFFCSIYFLSYLFFAYQLSAFDFQQTEKGKNLADTTKNKISATAKDSTLLKKKRIILNPLHSISLLEENLSERAIHKKVLESIDYRTTADYFTNIPFGFVRDLGWVGQPNETLVFGQGYGKISFLSDGIQINNRFSNSFDLNLFQSESIDSIEVVPLSRGFLYGSTNNPVSINFIPREPNINKSYSRIKFYQAPNSEGFFDGIFSVNPFNKLHAYVEIANQSAATNYINTDYSNWSGTTRLSYLLSNTVNIIASYKYAKSEVQLNGGVDADSIRNNYLSSQFDQILYDKFLAPVRFFNRYQKVTVQDFQLKMLAKFFDNSFTDISFYSQSGLTEFRQNENNLNFQQNASIIFDNNESKTIGGNLKQDFTFDFAKITSITNIEKTTFASPLLAETADKSFFSTSAIASFGLLNRALAPSFFGKYLSYAKNSYVGFGADLSLSLDHSLKFYGGISSFEKPYSIWEERFILPNVNLNKQKITSAETAVSFENKFAKVSLSYFNQTSSNTLMPAILKEDSLKSDRALYSTIKDLSLQGINLRLDFKLWKILLSTNTSFYFSEQNRHDYDLPQFTSNGGIFYIDTLFNNNLHLKTGINYSSIGPRDNIRFDFEKSISSNYLYDPTSQSTTLISPLQFSSTFQIDFFVAGRIQEKAIVYFVYENMLNAKYFVAPYYPKQSRGIRFGVAWEFLD